MAKEKKTKLARYYKSVAGSKVLSMVLSEHGAVKKIISVNTQVVDLLLKAVGSFQ